MIDNLLMESLGRLWALEGVWMVVMVLVLVVQGVVHKVVVVPRLPTTIC